MSLQFKLKCDSCNKILGPRDYAGYSCLVCPDHDICLGCYSLGNYCNCCKFVKMSHQRNLVRIKSVNYHSTMCAQVGLGTGLFIGAILGYIFFKAPAKTIEYRNQFLLS